MFFLSVEFGIWFFGNVQQSFFYFWRKMEDGGKVSVVLSIQRRLFEIARFVYLFFYNNDDGDKEITCFVKGFFVFEKVCIFNLFNVGLVFCQEFGTRIKRQFLEDFQDGGVGQRQFKVFVLVGFGLGIVLGVYFGFRFFVGFRLFFYFYWRIFSVWNAQFG